MGMNEIDAGHRLGHRVLDLQPRVHLQEVEPRVVSFAFEQEFAGAGVAIPHRFRRGNGRRAHALAHRRAERRTRAFLDRLLMPALRRAFALEQVHRVAVRIGEHLDLHMPRALDQPLDIQGVVTE